MRTPYVMSPVLNARYFISPRLYICFRCTQSPYKSSPPPAPLCFGTLEWSAAPCFFSDAGNSFFGTWKRDRSSQQGTGSVCGCASHFLFGGQIFPWKSGCHLKPNRHFSMAVGSKNIRLGRITSQASEQKLRKQTKRQVFLDELKACRDAERGKKIQADAIESGYGSCVYVSNALVSMYAKCGCILEARQVFNEMKEPDVIAYTALMLGYAANGEGLKALDLFAKMKSRGCTPDSIAFVAVLKACTSLALENDGNRRAVCLERGKRVHSEIGSYLNPYVQSALIDMYAKCGSMLDARRVFDDMKLPDVVSWNALLLGYADNGEGATALDLFAKMRSRGLPRNRVSFLAVLKACTSFLEQDGSGRTECLQHGRQIHSDFGFCTEISVQNTLIDMYSKCGSMTEAHRVFDSIKHPNVVSWTALISGYATNGDAVTALNLFQRMKSRGCRPDSITLVAAFKAYSLLGALESGSKTHAEMDTGTDHTAILVSCLVDFYAKCGNLIEAQKVFDSSHPRVKDLRSWTALMAGYSRLGDTKAVFELFEGMQDAGFQPDEVTFVCILTCCSHAGLVEKANEFFEAMTTSYGIRRTVEHYTCMADILGRSNKLDDAMALLQSMQCSPDSVTWMTLLGSCHKWKNLEIGRLAFESLVSLDDGNATAYVLMAHIYGSKGMWEQQREVLGMRIKYNAWKEVAQSSWTNEGGMVHVFLVGDSKKHSQIGETEERLRSLA